MELTADIYADALKKVSIKTKEEQYMLMEFGYDKKCVVPLKQAVTIIECLENAQLFDENYGSKTPTLKPVQNEFRFRMFSEKELKDVKVAMLLDIPLQDIQKLHRDR
jgi:hypothetical protein